MSDIVFTKDQPANSTDGYGLYVHGRRHRLAQIEQFHRAFGFAVAPEPGVPVLTSYDKLLITERAEQLSTIGRSLRAQATDLRGLGLDAAALVLIRLQLVVEEAGEVAAAVVEGDVAHILQELSDLDYVVGGFFLTFGLQGCKAGAEDELHRANMSKAAGAEGGQVDAAGRARRGGAYTAPDMGRVLVDRPGGA